MLRQAKPRSRPSGERRHLHPSPLGSGDWVTNQDGTVAEKEAYYPWGGNWVTAGPGVYDNRFAGMQPRDGYTGLDDTQFRMYESRLGRWLSPDPLGGDLTNPQSLNRYAYVLNNPATLTDPLGLSGCSVMTTPDDPFCFTTEFVDPSKAPSMGPILQGSDAIEWEDPLDTGNFFSSGVNYRNLNTGKNASGGTAQTSSTPGTMQTIKGDLCSSLPQGRTIGVAGGIGGIGGQTGSLELVVNYKSGQVSGFSSGGFQLGWNGGAQGSGFTGVIYGDLQADNGGYHGGFTSISGNARLGGFLSVSSGGPSAPFRFRPVSVAGVNLGVSLIPTPTLTGSAVNYSKPVQLGKYWALANPVDFSLFLAQQVCK